MRIVWITIIIFFSFFCNKKPKVQNKNQIFESNSLSLADAEKFGIEVIPLITIVFFIIHKLTL